MAHSYWRLNISANDGDINFLAIAELELCTINGTDQCVGGTASASSADATSNAAAAFDDNNTTRWSTATSGILTGWLRYQFPFPVNVAKYTIRGHPTEAARSPRTWTLEWSDDGSSWTVLHTVTNSSRWGLGEFRVFLVSEALAEQVVTKISSYAVLDGVPEGVSTTKLSSYALLDGAPNAVSATKLSGYALLDGAPNSVSVTKLAAYAILMPPVVAPGEDVARTYVINA